MAKYPAAFITVVWGFGFRTLRLARGFRFQETVSSQKLVIALF